MQEINTKSLKKELLATCSLLIGSSIIVLISSILLIASISFAFSWPISFFQFIIAACISIFFVWWGTGAYCGFEQGRFKIFLVLVFINIIIFSASLYVSGKVYDLSWDGQEYHQEAIIQLSQGWNPFKDELIIPDVHYVHKWIIEHYAKGPWICAAIIYKLTNNIEQGKLFNILLVIASFAVSLSAFLNVKRLKFGMALVLSLLLSFNPVSITQTLSFYVDGQLSSLLIIIIALSYLLFLQKSRFLLLVVFLSIVVTINIKFTGLVYALILSLGLLVLLFFNKKREQCLVTLKVYAFSFLIGIFLSGYNPYVTNILKHGNPFYPLAGKNAADIMSYNSPNNFRSMNRFGKLFYSLFSVSKNVSSNEETTFKIPFSISQSELQTFHIPDTRIGGFGPLFGGAIILTLLIILIAKKLNSQATNIGMIIISWILLSVFINPEAWWARYAPQLWTVPIISIVLANIIERGKLLKYLSYLLTVLLMVNILLIEGFYTYSQLDANKMFKKQMAKIANDFKKPVSLDFSTFISNRVRFDYLGIPYKEVNKSECFSHIQLIHTKTIVCSDDKL